MKKECACGFIVEEPRGWLLCHATNSGNRWDLPKGRADLDEDHLECAIRELYEETDLIINDRSKIKDLGQYEYLPNKDIHLFHIKLDTVDVKNLRCTSLVTNTKHPSFPEMDAFGIFPKNKVLLKLGKSLKVVIEKHFMFMLE